MFWNSRPAFRRWSIRTRLAKFSQTPMAPEKCDFMKKEVEFLGIFVGGMGWKSARRRFISSGTGRRRPLSRRSDRSPGLFPSSGGSSRTSAKLVCLWPSSRRRWNNIHDWDASFKTSFNELKEGLTQAHISRHGDWTPPFRGHMYDSQTAIGGTLTQVLNGKEHPVAYFSRKLNK